MRKGMILFPIVFSLLAFWGCSKFKVAKFVMPTWDTQFSAPLFNRTYTLGELLSKSDTTVSNGDTTFINAQPPSYVFNLLRTQSINGVQIGDNLKINSVPPTSASNGIDSIKIDPPPPIHYAFANPLLAPLVGSTAPVPSISPPQTQRLNPDQPFNRFHSATFSGGTLSVVLHNSYPAKIIFTTGINITDTSNQVIFNIPVPGDSLGINQTITLTHTLASYTLPNNPRVAFTDTSAGAASGFFQTDTIVAVSFTLTNLLVSQAIAIVPKESPINVKKSLVLSDSNKVQTATIDSGSMNITVANDFDMAIPIKLVIDDLKNIDGVSLTDTFEVSRKGLVTKVYPLNNYTLNMGGTDSLPYAVTAYIIGSDTTAPDGGFINIGTNDSVKATFDLTDLRLKNFTGEVHLKNTVSIPTDTQKIDLGDFKSKFSGTVIFSSSTNLQMDLKMSNPRGFPILAHIKMMPANSGSSYQGDSVVVEHLVDPTDPSTESFSLGPDFVTKLNSFSQNTGLLPDEFIIGGYVVINPPPYKTATANDTDRVLGTGTISMPFNLGIVNAKYQDTTKTAVVSDSSSAAKLVNIDSGSVVIQVWNGMPMAVTMIGELIDTTTHLPVVDPVTRDTVFIPRDSIKVNPADVDANGNTIDSVYSSKSVALTQFMAKSFGTAYMRFLLRVATPSGVQTVPFTKNNEISIKMYANVTLKVDKNLTGGK